MISLFPPRLAGPCRPFLCLPRLSLPKPTPDSPTTAPSRALILELASLLLEPYKPPSLPTSPAPVLEPVLFSEPATLPTTLAPAPRTPTLVTNPLQQASTSAAAPPSEALPLSVAVPPAAASSPTAAPSSLSAPSPPPT
jgi:hypothetical protein